MSAGFISAKGLPRRPIEIADEGRVRITTPPDPRSGSTEFALDPPEWIHAITSQIPDRRQHVVRYYGAYA
jgi:hypothetical protein